MPALAQTDVDFYRERGYLVLRNLFPAEEVAEWRRELERLCAGAAAVSQHTDVYDLEESHRPEAPRVRRIKLPHKVSPLFGRLCRDERILAPVRDLLGPSVRLQTSKINLKSAGYGAPVEWHQDWAFYPHTNDDVLAVGVMLDDMTAENGPLMVLPGSHRGPVYDHHAEGRFCGGIDPATTQLDASGAVALTGPAGSITLHHVRLVHGSDLNRSGRDRRFMLYEMSAADAWPLHGTSSPFTDLEEYNSRLLCGEPTTLPRMQALPVRIPLPKPLHQGSLYQAQRGQKARFFETFQAAPERALEDAD